MKILLVGVLVLTVWSTGSPAQTLNVLYNFQSESLGASVNNIVLTEKAIYASLQGGGPVFQGAVVELTRPNGGRL